MTRTTFLTWNNSSSRHISTTRAVTEGCAPGSCMRMLQGEKKLSACFLQFTSPPFSLQLFPALLQTPELHKTMIVLSNQAKKGSNLYYRERNVRWKAAALLCTVITKPFQPINMCSLCVQLSFLYYLNIDVFYFYWYSKTSGNSTHLAAV